MFRTVRKALRQFHIPTRAERELSYLSQSVSLYDLESRQREIDAGLFAVRF